jgi:hypothetical protein
VFDINPRVTLAGKIASWTMHFALGVPTFKEFLLVLFSSNREKQGGAPRQQKYMDRFKEALEDCGLDDLGFVGDPFTWRNHSHTSERYI